METTGLIILGFICLIASAVGLLFYIIGGARNIRNVARLLSQATIHPEDFGRMYYLTHAQMNLLRNNGHKPDRPGWYVDGDEFADVIKTRPREDHV